MIQYTQQKGFCEDLDEGKFSLPLIHTIQNSSSRLQLVGILQEHRTAGKLSAELKRVLLEHMRTTGSLEYTEVCLETLREEINNELLAIERAYGAENYILRLLLERLRV